MQEPEEPFAPGEDVILVHALGERAHALSPFLFREIEDVLEHGGGAFVVVRVHYEGFAHLFGGARELA